MFPCNFGFPPQENVLAMLFKQCSTNFHAHDVSERKKIKKASAIGAEQKKGTHAVQQMLLVNCSIIFHVSFYLRS